MSITVAHLQKTYGEQRALDDVSFSVSRGEIVGFLGPNGAGKSTTMKILTGYLPASGGEARISGISVEEDPLGVKRRTGYLPESNPLYPEMYVREALAFTAGVYRVRNARDRIEEMIRLTGLAPEARKRIGALSKGYRQRMGLAQALLHDPEVLILDEPTSGLDPNQLADIRQMIRDIARDKTVLFSTHIMQEVAALCDRVIIISRGRIVADDRLSRLQGGGTRIQVEFSEPVSETLLKGIPGVTALDAVPPAGWRMETSDPDGVKKRLWELALQNTLNIVSLQSEKPRLEDIFRQLTTGEDHPGTRDSGERKPAT